MSLVPEDDLQNGYLISQYSWALTALWLRISGKGHWGWVINTGIQPRTGLNDKSDEMGKGVKGEGAQFSSLKNCINIFVKFNLMPNRGSINLSVSLFKFFITLSFTTYQLHTIQKSHSWEWSIFRTYINTGYTQYTLSSNCIRTS